MRRCVIIGSGRLILALIGLAGPGIAFAGAVPAYSASRGPPDAAASLQAVSVRGGRQRLGCIAISADGTTVIGPGYRWRSSEELRTHPGPRTAFGPFMLYDLSADGAVAVGQVHHDGKNKVVRWRQGTGLEFLKDVPDGPLPGDGAARAISMDAAVIAGSYDIAPKRKDRGYHLRGFRWTEAEGFEDLGDPDGNEAVQVRGISGDGRTIVGYWGDDANLSRAFVWTGAAGMRSLPSLETGRYSAAFGASEDGHVIVGSSDSENSWAQPRPVAWSRARGDDPAAPYEVLALAPDETTGGEAVAVSGDGSIVVGWYLGDQRERPFLWTAQRGFQDLEVVLEKAGVVLPAGGLGRIADISADGRTIIGSDGWIATLPRNAGGTSSGPVQGGNEARLEDAPNP